MLTYINTHFVFEKYLQGIEIIILINNSRAKIYSPVLS